MARSLVKKKPGVLSFKSFVGSKTYDVWVEMLKTLVPHGRTHRLAVVVAGMIQHAADTIYKKDRHLYEELFDYTSHDNDDMENRKIIPYVEKLFEDAKVKPRRTNSRGQPYSIIESALVEHERWDFMPWE